METEAATEVIAPPSAFRRWAPRVVGVLIALILVVLIAIGSVVAPYVRDDQKLDAIVRAVALDWRDFGRDKAMERLQYELDHQQISEAVGDSDCAFEGVEGEPRSVRCAWSVRVPLPMVDVELPLDFVSTASIDVKGDVQ